MDSRGNDGRDEEPSPSIWFSLPTSFDVGLESLLLALCVATHESTRGSDNEPAQWRVRLERHRPAVGTAFRNGVECMGRSHRHRPARPHTLHHHAPPRNPFGDNRLDIRRKTPRTHSDLDSHPLSHRQIVGAVVDDRWVDNRRGGRVCEEVECVFGRHAKSDCLGELRGCHTISVAQPGSSFSHRAQRVQWKIVSLMIFTSPPEVNRTTDNQFRPIESILPDRTIQLS